MSVHACIVCMCLCLWGTLRGCDGARVIMYGVYMGLFTWMWGCMCVCVHAGVWGLYVDVRVHACVVCTRVHICGGCTWMWCCECVHSLCAGVCLYAGAYTWMLGVCVCTCIV